MALKIGVIGTGGIGQGHIRRIMDHVPGAVVTAVNDVNRQSAEASAALCGARVMENPHALIRSEDVDAVLIASWDGTHEEFCVSAIAAGKYVFCEKPLSDTAEGCARIMQAEQAGGRRLLTVGFMRRCDTAYREAREAIAAGKIGLPLLVHAQHRNVAPTGAKHTTEMSASGALVHEFDVTRFLIGEDDTYVTAQWAAPRSTRFCDPDLIDPQMVFLETKNGVRVDLEIFMNCKYGYDIRCEVVGETGTVSLPAPSHAVLRSEGSVGFTVVPTWQARFGQAYRTELCEWAEDVRAGRLRGPSAWDGYITSKVAEACHASRLNGGGIVPVAHRERPAFYAK